MILFRSLDGRMRASPLQTDLMGACRTVVDACVQMLSAIASQRDVLLNIVTLDLKKEGNYGG